MDISATRNSPVMTDLHVQQHSLPVTVGLSLLPGLVGLIPTAFAVPLFQRLSLPPVMAFSLIGVPFIILYYLLFLLVTARQNSGNLASFRLIPYRKSMPLWQYLVFLPPLLVWTLVVVAVLSPLDLFLKENLFAWAPAWLSGIPEPNTYTTRQLAFLIPMYLVLNGILGPVLEEVYYRGYLLPRISRFGWWAPVLNTILFYAHHPTLWSIISGTIAFLPTTLLVYRKQNIMIAIWAHVILNLLSGLVLLGFLVVPA